MSLTVLTNFIRILDYGGEQGDIPDEGDLKVKTQYALQNGWPGQRLKLTDVVPGDNNNYEWLGFIYQGAALTLSGDNLESTLLLANNDISMNIALEAVQKRWQVRIETWVMATQEDPKPKKRLAMEKWIAASIAYDAETIEITLASAIDAITASIPQKVLTADRVGDLPVTGSIQTR